MAISKSEGVLVAGESSSPDEEKRIFEELEAAALSTRKEGDLYYIVSGKWWRVWQNYVGSERFNLSPSLSRNEDFPCRPGQIDNTELISNDMEVDGNELIIDRNLMEGQDYILVPEAVWMKLVKWYGGGPSLTRRLLLNRGLRENTWMVEVHLFSLHLVDARDNSQQVFHISRKESIRELYNKCCTLLKLEQSKVRILDHFNGRKGAVLPNSDQLIEDVLVMNQEILLELLHDGPFIPNQRGTLVENELALVPFESPRTFLSIAGEPTLSNDNFNRRRPDSLHDSNGLYTTDKDPDDAISRLRSRTKMDDRGLTGLHNLGNTCFMNSAIQCLVHTPPLAEYFLSDFSSEINKENPLGMFGELAVAFGDLLRKLWSSGRTPVTPRTFKAKLGLFAPQFSGYNQHDSQELLAFLLDGLHEDLNRVKNKPYIEVKDADGRPDEEYAEECWANHIARNDSIIVDICQGQYKSTLVCPVCSKVSVTFDPFMYLSLPLPSSVNKSRTITVTVIRGSGSALPMPFTVTVPKHGCCKDLTQAVSTACCLNHDEDLLLAEVYEHRIYRYLDNASELLSTVRDVDQLVGYTLPRDHEKLLRLVIMHKDSTKCSSGRQSSIQSELIGTPLVTCLPKGLHTASSLLTAAELLLKPLVRTKLCTAGNKEVENENNSTPLRDITIEENCEPHQLNMESYNDGVSSFKISITDVNVSTSSPISNDPTPYTDPCLHLVIEWSREQHNKYDFSCLEDFPFCKSGFQLKKTRQEVFSLFSCLDAFLNEEPLGPDDMWYCPSCKEHRQATKKLDLWRLPDILVIHLKRFSYSRFLKNKLDTFVDFPVHNFNLGKYLKHQPSSVFELYALSNHYGGLGGGHYTAYAKLINENSWYHFDDSHVSSVSEESIRTSAAYVLFYRRVKVE